MIVCLSILNRVFEWYKARAQYTLFVCGVGVDAVAVCVVVCRCLLPFLLFVTNSNEIDVTI